MEANQKYQAKANGPKVESSNMAADADMGCCRSKQFAFVGGVWWTTNVRERSHFILESWLRPQRHLISFCILQFILSSTCCVIFLGRDSPMEILLSAVLGELTTRSINFFISRSSKPSALDVEDRLRRVLLRAQVIVDEAMGRHITNQAMLLQVNLLRDAMHRGYYTLDTFRYLSHDEEDAKDQVTACLAARWKQNLSSTSYYTHGLMVLKNWKSCQLSVPEESARAHLSLMFARMKGEGCVMKYQSNSNKDGRLLVVVDSDGDLNEVAWNRLYSASRLCMPSGSKIIVTSRSDKIVQFGTTQALTLKYLSYEAYWYFFKTLTFGSIDPEMHPRLMHLAMEIARTLNGNMIRANIAACILRDNFDIHFWCKVLVFLRGFIQKHVSRFGEHPFDLLDQNRPVHLGRMATPYEEFVVYHQYQRSSQEEVPKIRFQDVMCGNVKPHGKFEVLAWRSRIPPYYSYVDTCEIQELKPKAAKRKRS